MSANKAVDAQGEVSNGHSTSEKWKRHEFLDALYKFYLDKILSFHAVYLPIFGGVVSYILANQDRLVSLGLIVPLVISVGAAVILFSGIREAKELNAAIRNSAAALGILATHAHMLVRAVTAFFVLHIVIAFGLMALLYMMFIYGGIPVMNDQISTTSLLWSTSEKFRA